MDVTKIISWLPFNESTTQDFLENTWTANGNPAIENGALKLDGNSSYLSKDEPITLGGQDFTIRGKFNMSSDTGKWARIFSIFNTAESEADAIRLARDNTSSNLAILVFNTSNTTAITLGRDYDFELDYSHDEGKVRFFLDGVLKVTITKTIEQTTFTKIYLGKSNFSADGYFVGKVSQFMILDGVALHSENFTPPTANDYVDWQLAVAGYAPVKISFDVETYLRNAQKGWRVYNPGEAELLDTTGATTVEVPYTQSVTGKAFYGGTLSDMFHTPAGLKEIWIRFDFSVRGDHDAVQRVGHWNNSSNTVFGLGSNRYWNGSYWVEEIAFNGETILMPERNQLYQCLLHIKSDATDGLVELTIDKEIHTWTGNINDGNDLNNLVVLSQHSDMRFSNVVVSETELTLDDGWHRDSFGVETKITAPVLNIRLQGSNVKFPLSTKRKANSLAIRVGDRNFYNTSVATDSTLAGAARYLLDDEARALSTAT